MKINFKIKQLLIMMGVTISLGTFSVVVQADALQPQMTSNTYRVDHYTRSSMEKMLIRSNLQRHLQPNVSSRKIKNLNSARDFYHPGQKLDVTDSWSLKTANGKIANYHGYHLVFGLTSNHKNGNKSFEMNSKIYLFYQKVKDAKKGVNSWKSAGPVFYRNSEGANDPNDFSTQTGEWSGSAVLQPNGQIRLFYTDFDASQQKQSLATAAVQVNYNNGIWVNHAQNQDKKIIFSGDGHYYETTQSFLSDNNRSKDDDHCLRDPYYVESNGNKYLVFEANTAEVSPAGDSSVYNQANLGGGDAFQQSQYHLFQTNRNLAKEAAYNNGAIGIVQLDNNYEVKNVLPPLMVFNTVDDETERPSVVNHNGKWYMFTSMHGWHMASSNVNKNDAFLLGFSSNSLMSGYKPLNHNGLVLYSNRSINARNYNYSFSVNQSKKNPFVITSYANFPDNHKTGYSTFAPSILMNINGNKTTLKKKVLQQGQLIR